MNSKIKIFSLIVLLAIAVCSAVVFANKWRTDSAYEKISISGNYTIPDEDILKFTRLDGDTVINLDETDLALIQDRILKHPEVKKVFVSKEPPSELKIEIVEKTPIAIINMGKEIKLVDNDLEIFPFKNSEMIFDLPIISGIKFPENPRELKNLKSNEEIKIALFLISTAFKNSKSIYSYISEINLSDMDKIIVYSNDKSIPFFFPRKKKDMTDAEYSNELVLKLKLFGGVIEQVLPDKLNEHFRYVDLRFSNQVVVNTKQIQTEEDEPQS